MGNVLPSSIVQRLASMAIFCFDACLCHAQTATAPLICYGQVTVLFQDMCKKRFVYVKELKVLVLDEADVMLDQDVLSRYARNITHH